MLNADTAMIDDAIEVSARVCCGSSCAIVCVGVGGEARTLWLGGHVLSLQFCYPLLAHSRRCAQVAWHSFPARPALGDISSTLPPVPDSAMPQCMELEKEQPWLELAAYLIKHFALRRRLLADSMPA
jgi:hypothetical protein